jgi:D-alanine transfer protein
MNNRSTHLIPTLAAILIFTGVLLGGAAYARALESRYIRSLAPLLLDQSTVGSAMQTAAFQQPDLLPIYGSSEIIVDINEYSAMNFFKSYPTGFNVYEIEMDGGTSLTWAKCMAALGDNLRGKKVVISFTPTMFQDEEADPKWYRVYFSTLQAYAMAFNTHLSYDVKRLAARRMTQYPETLEKEPLLKLSLRILSNDSFLHRAAYDLIYPLGLARLLVLRLQDHWEMLNYIWSHPALQPDVTIDPKIVNWQALLKASRQEQAAHTNTNPYGIENSNWLAGFPATMPQGISYGERDNNFLRRLRTTKEWGDLEILLTVLQELGAQPLIISHPFNGPLWDAWGISRSARQDYYDRLERVVARYGFPLIDFREFDDDPLFAIDRVSHTSRIGWVHVDQALDAFYHDAPIPYVKK